MVYQIKKIDISYAHATSLDEVKRQQVLLNAGTFNNRVMQFYIDNLTDSYALQGKIIIDLGCGNGDLACILAQHVGSSGRVIAIDNNEKQINNLCQLIQANGLAQITPVLGNALDLPSLLTELGIQQVDGVHIRFFLTHLPPEKQKKIYGFVKEALAPNGFIAVGEGILSRSKSHDIFVDDWISACSFVQKILNVNYDYGLDLIKDLYNHGFSIKASQEMAGDPIETKDKKLGICTDFNDIVKILKENIESLPTNDQKDAAEFLKVCLQPDFDKIKQNFILSDKRKLSLSGMFALAKLEKDEPNE